MSSSDVLDIAIPTFRFLHHCKQLMNRVTLELAKLLCINDLPFIVSQFSRTSSITPPTEVETTETTFICCFILDFIEFIVLGQVGMNGLDTLQFSWGYLKGVKPTGI